MICFIIKAMKQRGTSSSTPTNPLSNKNYIHVFLAICFPNSMTMYIHNNTQLPPYQ